MTKEQCRACGKWFEDSELDRHLSEHMDDEPESVEEVEAEIEPLTDLPQPLLKSPLSQVVELDRKRSLSHSTKYSPQETLSKADIRLRASGYDVRVQGSTLQALSEGHGREYQWAFVGLFLVIAFFLAEVVLSFFSFFFYLSSFLLLISIPFYIYWWFANRGQNRIVLSVAAGQFTIRYDGSTAFRDAEELSKLLRE